MTNLVLEPELEKVWLALTDDEYSTLEKQILRDGCLDTLKVWDRDGKLVLLDGHNRLKICKKYNLPFETSTIEIDSLEEAIVWIVDNQAGRRNATKEQRDYISGKRYEAEKIIRRRRDEKGQFKSNAPSTEKLYPDEGGQHQPKTILRRAEAEGVSHFTIDQNQKFSQGVDLIKELNPSIADSILKSRDGRPPLTKTEVSTLPRLKKKLDQENPKKFSEIVVAGVLAIREAVKKERESHQKNLDDKKEEKERQIFDEFDKTANSKAYQAKEQMRLIKDSIPDGSCLLPNVMELICNDCNWGFDVYLPTPHEATPTCPYCQGSNIDKRDEDWNPRYEALKCQNKK